MKKTTDPGNICHFKNKMVGKNICSYKIMCKEMLADTPQPSLSIQGMDKPCLHPGRHHLLGQKLDWSFSHLCTAVSY